MYCKQCGKEIPEGARFCANCGIPVNKISVKSTPERAASKHKTRFMLIIATCATVIFGIGIVLLFGRKKYDGIADWEDGQWLFRYNSEGILVKETSYLYDLGSKSELEYDAQETVQKIHITI